MFNGQLSRKKKVSWEGFVLLKFENEAIVVLRCDNYSFERIDMNMNFSAQNKTHILIDARFRLGTFFNSILPNEIIIKDILIEYVNIYLFIYSGHI